MPRPRIAEKRDRQINVALTQREYAGLEAKANAVGLRLVDYARAVMLRRRIAADALLAASTVDRTTLEGIRRIGVNLNQACRQFNTFGHAVPADLEPLLRDIRVIVAKAFADGA